MLALLSPVASANNISAATEGLLNTTSSPISDIPLEEAPSAQSIDPQAHLEIDLSDRRVRLYQGETEIASYPVAVGRSGWETPTGQFEIFQMVENPSWRHPWNGNVVGPGPENPLGQHWIGFWSNGKEVIGFHGTPNEASVGTAASHGCIRMLNADVAELFSRVEVGIPVSVVH